MRGRGWMLGLLVAFSLAWAAPRPGPGRPDLPKPPDPPTVLPFAQARIYVARAAGVLRALEPGTSTVLPTPQGPRRVLLLNYQGRPVAFAYLGPGPTLQDSGAAPLLGDDAEVAAALSDADQATLAGIVARLSVSGLVQVVGPQVRTYLLWQGRQVAELHFDRRSGALVPDPGGPPKAPRRLPHP